MSFDLHKWINAPVVVHEIDALTHVVRDDLLEGGTKLRFLPFVCEGAEEVIYGTPFCGGAQAALSVYGRESGTKITLFSAKRAALHRRQQFAMANGARYEWCSPGYMTVVQKRARDYAASRGAGALFLPLGFDTSKAEPAFCEFLERFRKSLGKNEPDEVWCAAGSGMLARCLGQVFLNSRVLAVAVGLASKHEAQRMLPNVSLLPCDYKFEQECKSPAPFPSCPNYDRKAFAEMMRLDNSTRRRRLFWNVLG